MLGLCIFRLSMMMPVSFKDSTLLIYLNVEAQQLSSI